MTKDSYFGKFRTTRLKKLETALNNKTKLGQDYPCKFHVNIHCMKSLILQAKKQR